MEEERGRGGPRAHADRQKRQPVDLHRTSEDRRREFMRALTLCYWFSEAYLSAAFVFTSGLEGEDGRISLSFLGLPVPPLCSFYNMRCYLIRGKIVTSPACVSCELGSLEACCGSTWLKGDALRENELSNGKFLGRWSACPLTKCEIKQASQSFSRCLFQKMYR